MAINGQSANKLGMVGSPVGPPDHRSDHRSIVTQRSQARRSQVLCKTPPAPLSLLKHMLINKALTQNGLRTQSGFFYISQKINASTPRARVNGRQLNKHSGPHAAIRTHTALTITEPLKPNWSLLNVAGRNRWRERG